jgi:hypothetical protein
LHQDNSVTTISGNVVKYYGFYFPPVGIIGLLDLLYLPWDSVFYIIDPLLGQELPYDEIEKESNAYVIITTHEGASHRWFDRLIPKLQSLGIPSDHIILRSACLWDPDSPIRNIHTIVDECSDFITGLEQSILDTSLPTHHYVCLNRGHRWQRYQLVKEILDRGLGQFGKLSYIELPANADPRFINLIKPDPNWHEQRDVTDPDISGALFNVISETAYEPLVDSEKLIHHHRPGITEKTYKCFALYQIPVWVAPYRAVACYRQLGFDVFDDIVDHGYDLELDPVKRIGMVAEQIQKFCNLTHQQLGKLKLDLEPRFQKNFQVLNSHAHNFNTELPQWQALFSYNNPN